MFFFHLLNFLIGLLPSPFTLLLGRFLGSLFYLLDKKHRQIALLNLKAAFPEYHLPQIKRIARQAFQHLVLLGLETLILSRKSTAKLRDQVLDQGFENLEKARNQGKAILFLTGHVGHWELLARLGRWAGFLESVIARDVKGKMAQEWLHSIRSRHDVYVISKGQIRHIVDAFEHGQTVGALIDQDGGRRGSFVRFFGRLASTPTGIIRLGLKSGVPILPVFLRRTSDRLEYRLYIGKDISLGLENLTLQEKEKKALERFTQDLEKFIREDPGQWLWPHRRWKTRPLNEASAIRKKILLLHDGKPGHFNQLLGILKGLQDWEHQSVVIQYRSKFHRLIVYLSILARILKMGILKWALSQNSLNALSLRSPSLILSCGSIAAPAATILKSYYGAKSVVIMRSGFLNVEKSFDLAILPFHDHPSENKRVLRLLGIPTPITEKDLKEAAQTLSERFTLTSQKKIGILVGGNSKRQNMKMDQMKTFALELLKTSQKQNAEILLATSRRTPEGIGKMFKDILGGKPGVHLLWAKENPESPIPGILGLSDVVLVTEDSFSMLMESLHSGRPVISLRLSQKGFRPLKYEKTLEVMEKEGRIYRRDETSFVNVLEPFLANDRQPSKVNNVETDQAVNAILKLMEI
ncbi:MAG: mitochondrial fission ELM1 family protein [Chlamydiae bacterium]|nr:mitochondrial fission ELM1 family protein [Chlamydiota bacterium]MBI3277866.1 mitochondrial fission ELM1 family protein [Chlamydiota bacterium]